MECMSRKLIRAVFDSDGTILNSSPRVWIARLPENLRAITSLGQNFTVCKALSDTWFACLENTTRDAVGGGVTIIVLSPF